MVFTNLPLTQEFKTLGMDGYLWVQALFNHEELERLRGVEPTDPHQRFLWRIIRMGVIDPEAGEKTMDTSTRSMRNSSAIGMRLWKMWREAESRVSPLLLSFVTNMSSYFKDNSSMPRHSWHKTQMTLSHTLRQGNSWYYNLYSN